MPDLRWGLTVPLTGVPLADHADLFRRIEAGGYDDVWTSETAGHDGFTPLAIAATATERLRLATGVVNPFTRGPALLAQHCAALADASGGRFVLGLGSSSNVIVERWNGVPFEKPLDADARGDRGAAPRARRRARAGRLQARDAAGGAGADRRRGAAREDARARRASSATARSRTSCR